MSSQAIAVVGQENIYVSPDGDDDNNDGSLSHPWKTIQKAADNVAPGDTVYVRDGIYNEAVFITASGSAAGGYVTFQSYPGETAVLDGTGLSDPDGVNGIYIADHSYLIIRGFEIRNYTTTIPDSVPMGIQIAGSAHHVELRDNRIHHIETNAPVDGNLLGADAHGIAVYGDKAQSIHDIIIDGNELYSLTLGSSEAMVLNGNVELFTISNNIVHDCDNIAIDLIGFEETAPDPTYDQARNGVVISNTIYAIDTIENPAYGGERSAAGIYVDGGTQILIERNRIFSANIGIEIASEHSGRATSHVTVRNNLLFNNHIAGIAMGGYDVRRGSTEDCVIVNNTLYNNDTMQDGNGEIMIQFDTRNNVIKNNIVHANNPQSLLISNPYLQNTGNVVDYNLYFAPEGIKFSEWQWKKETFTGFEAYRAATGKDAHSMFNSPQFIDTVAPDLHLQATSPAIDAGENLPEVGDYDIDGDARAQGGKVDMGADEVPTSGYVYLPAVMR